VGFFQTFWSWLNGQLATYIGATTAKVAAILEPAVVTFATVYVMVWGYLQMTGRIDEPLMAGLKRMTTLALVLGIALHLWLYNSIIVDTFYQAPVQFAAAVAGAADPVTTIDAIWSSGGTAAGNLFTNGWWYRDAFGYCLAGIIIWALVGMLCVYTMFLIALSSIALSVLLALGPLFLTALLFDGTRRLFESWIGQLTNYALITVITVLVAGLLLQIVASYASQTAARGTGISLMDTLNMLLMSLLVFLLMRQVMPIASGLATGVALSSYGAVSRAIVWGLSVPDRLRAKLS
jgi:type IV secretion system protein VirB6